jgi:ABC-type branched-subunit amino acid transport system permease subunit
VLAALFVSGAYPELADWPNSGQAIFAVMLGGINSFLGPVLGAMILLALNDVVTRFTEYQGLDILPRRLVACGPLTTCRWFFRRGRFRR